MIMLSTLLLFASVTGPIKGEHRLQQAPTAESAVLRAYGSVSKQSSAGKTVFTCKDIPHAEILLGKLLADFFWDAGEQDHITTKKVGVNTVVIHEFLPYGAISVFRFRNLVTVLGADSAQQLEVRLASERTFTSPEVRFAPQAPYPAYLDALDLRSVRFHDTPMRSLNANSLQSHWDFTKKFGDGGIQQTSLGFWSSSPAPGIIDWSPTDYMFSQAAKNSSLITLEPQVGGILPLWCYNSDPTSRAVPSPSMLMDAWGGSGTTSVPLEGFGQSSGDGQYGSLAFLRKVVERYSHDPQLVAWMPLNGTPGGEFAFHDRATAMLDYSEPGQQAFREWLANNRGFSLATLGDRWYGDPNYFNSWDKVTIPDVNSFFGDPFAKESIRLDGEWQWQPAPIETLISPTGAATLPNLPASEWVSFESAPSQWASLLPHVHSYIRKQIEVTPDQANSAKFLVIDAYVRAKSTISVWLNGQFLAKEVTFPFEPEALKHDQFAVPTGGRLKPGKNELVIDVPTASSPGSEGKILGPVFFTLRKPSRYPDMGAHANARFVDMKDWQAFGYYAKNDVTFRELRALDPNRPTILSGDQYYQLGDYEAELATAYGLGVENTGRESSFRPRQSGHGVVAGFYGTSEESSTAKSISALDAELGWMLLDADSSHVFYYKIDDNIKIEKETSWFTKNARLLQLIGKSMREEPSVLLLSDPETYRLGFDDPATQDIGNGPLPQMHLDNGYVTPTDIEKGIANGYPIIVDCGTRVMDQKLIDALAKYVEQGGTFVACGDSGRNSPTRPNAWPIEQLTGFSVRPVNEKGTVTFGSNFPFAPVLSGIKFPSNDPEGNSLSPTTSNSQTIATWADGSAAIGVRTLGKGRVIQIGFQDLGKSKFGLVQPNPNGGSSPERVAAIFLQGLGATRTSYSPSQAIWTRRLITKNGLQTWLVAINSEKSEVATELAVRTEVAPESVIDLETGKPVRFTYSSDGWVRFQNIAFRPNESHVFAMRRATLLDGVNTWWQEKVKYWQAHSSPVPLSLPAVENGNIQLSNWRYIAEPEGPAGENVAWKSNAFDDSKWKPIKNGPWKSLSPEQAQHKGNAKYRATFTVPNGWQGHEVSLNLYSYDTPVVFGKAQFFVDGKEVGSYNPVPGFGYSQTHNFDITAMAKPGSHTLTISVTRLAALDEVAGPFLSGSIWLSALPRFADQMEVSGGWDAIGDNWVTMQPYSAPGKVSAKYLKRKVSIPADWKGKSVFIQMKSPNPFATLVINGTLISNTITQQRFGNISLINLSPYVHPGGIDTIELWPQASVRNRDNSPKGQHSELQLTSAVIGTIQPADLPVRQ